MDHNRNFLSFPVDYVSFKINSSVIFQGLLCRTLLSTEVIPDYVRTADPYGLLSAEAGHGLKGSVYCPETQVCVQNSDPYRNAVYYFFYLDTFFGKRGKIHNKNLLDTS
jgi:hypothetical protein